jgi:tRNA-specific adenosine deaminase 3
MGSGLSRLSLPPDCSLEEITNRDLTGPMQFSPGLYATFPVRLTSTVIRTFEIERRRHIPRVRRSDPDSNDVILSYSADEAAAVLQKLADLGICTDVAEVPLPLWCPFSEAQRTQCLEFWPVDLVGVEVPALESIGDHRRLLEQVLTDRSVVITCPGSPDIVASDGSFDCHQCDGMIDHAIIRAARRASKAAPKTGSYLCTGLDVYAYGEPCIMCAMALVHSRVGRLFYIETNVRFGGIESQAQVHTNMKLNHRYRAFRVRTLKSVL